VLEDVPDMNLVWNNHAQILICNTCHVGVPLGEVASHLSNAHKKPFNKDILFNSLIAHNIKVPNTIVRYPVGYTAEEQKPSEPVQGLYVHDGNMCCNDGKVLPEEKSMLNHFEEHHPGMCLFFFRVEQLAFLPFDSSHFPEQRQNWMSHTKKVNCQSLHGHRHRKYFAVKISINVLPPAQPVDANLSSVLDNTNSNEATHLIRKLEAQDLPGFHSWSSIDVEEASISLFIKTTGILDCVETAKAQISSEELSSISDPEHLELWQPFFQAWLQNRMKGLHKVLYLVRRAALSTSSLVTYFLLWARQLELTFMS